MMTFTRRRAPDWAVKCGMKVCPAILPSVAGALLLAGASLHAAPMVSVGPHIGLHLEADLEFKSLSNITMAVENDQAREDIILKFTPGLQFVLFEESPKFDFSFGARRSFIHFMDVTNFNDEPWNLDFRTGYNGDLFGIGFNWGNRESLQNISSASQSSIYHIKHDDDIVLSDIENLGMKFHFAFSPKTGLRSGVSWNDTDYSYASGRTALLTDYEILTLPLDLFYEITPKLESILGYRFRRIDPVNAPDYKDHYLNLGLIGHVTAKTDLQMVLGYQNRSRNLASGKNQHFFAANLRWKYMATEKLHLLLGVNRDFGVGSGGGDSIEISSANAGLDILFTESVAFGASAQLQHSKYSMGRQDLGSGVGATLTIQPRNSHWAFRSGYRYDWTQFKDSGTTHDYKNHSVSLGTSYRY